jgi:hypothetical protein
VEKKVKLLAALLALPVGAIASGAPGFNSMDRDRDGYLSRDEVEAVMPELMTLFAQVDRNRDDKLNPAEFEAALKLLATIRS